MNTASQHPCVIALLGISSYRMIEPFTAPGYFLSFQPYLAVLIGALGGWLMSTLVTFTGRCLKNAR